jgi:hypothetical protein
VIRGTPLINSINRVHIILITGRLERLPRASTIPNGKASAIPVHPKTRVTSKPPHLFVETDSRPSHPFKRKKAITGKT